MMYKGTNPIHYGALFYFVLSIHFGINLLHFTCAPTPLIRDDKIYIMMHFGIKSIIQVYDGTHIYIYAIKCPMEQIQYICIVYHGTFQSIHIYSGVHYWGHALVLCRSWHR